MKKLNLGVLYFIALIISIILEGIAININNYGLIVSSTLLIIVFTIALIDYDIKKR